MCDPELESILSVALECAREAGKVLRRSQVEGFGVSSKSAKHDLVTTADMESERLIIRRIRETWPRHDVEGEEGKYPRTGSPYLWSIDPIDGTANFTRGLPFFAVSIGVLREGIPAVAVVHDPSHDETFWAVQGGGAFLNGRRIAVSGVRGIAGALLAAGFHYDRGEAMVRALETMRRFFDAGVMEIRRIGSAALEMSYVASGRLDGVWEHRLMSWDIAAGVLLVREAGGRVTDLEGQEKAVVEGFTVTSNASIHEALLAMIRTDLR